MNDANSKIGVKYLKKLWSIVLCAGMLLGLAGCKDLGKPHIIVATREYTGGIAGMDYSGWTETTSVLTQGMTIVNSSQYDISAVVSNVSSDSVTLSFSGPVVLQDKNTESDVFKLEKNRSYIFLAGLGTTGIEIKVRWN